MCGHLLRFILLLALLIVTSSPLWAAYPGYVERPWTPTTCGQETHFLTDPCTGNAQWLLTEQYGGIPMDPYLCTYVDVDGPDVGIECTVIQPMSVSPAQPPCPITFKSLRIDDATPPHLDWDRVTCAATYDVIRGALPGPASDGSRIDLGPVTCLANDFPQIDFWQVTGPVDPESPPVGQAYFYLVRAAGLPDGDMTYGHSSDGLEEVPLSGDCTP
jgi:hypothetical protein